jgi:hypothetical protein
LDPLLGAIGYGAEVTQLGAIAYGPEVRATLAHLDAVAPTWHRARRHRSWRRARMCLTVLLDSYKHKTSLAQLVEHKALHHVVLRSSPIVCILIFLSLLLICFLFMSLMSIQIYFSSRFFLSLLSRFFFVYH